jgi:hypothetical protein
MPLIWRCGIVPFLYCKIGITEKRLYQNRSPIEISLPGMQHLAQTVLYNTVMTTFLHFLYDLTASTFKFSFHLIKRMMWMQCYSIHIPMTAIWVYTPIQPTSDILSTLLTFNKVLFQSISSAFPQIVLFFLYYLIFSIINFNGANQISRYLMSVVYL